MMRRCVVMLAYLSMACGGPPAPGTDTDGGGTPAPGGGCDGTGPQPPEGYPTLGEANCRARFAYELVNISSILSDGPGEEVSERGFLPLNLDAHAIEIDRPGQTTELQLRALRPGQYVHGGFTMLIIRRSGQLFLSHYGGDHGRDGSLTLDIDGNDGQLVWGRIEATVCDRGLTDDFCFQWQNARFAGYIETLMATPSPSATTPCAVPADCCPGGECVVVDAFGCDLRFCTPEGGCNEIALPEDDEACR